MEKRNFAVTLVLLIMVLALLVAPMQLTASKGSPSSAPGRFVAAAHAPTPAVVKPASAAPFAGFPRTVVVETFTGVWCIHCPAESKGLHNIDVNSSHDVLAIAELHVCALPPPQCFENYVPPDGTSTSRGSFYGVGGFPTVFFDGTHASVGASDSTPQMQGQYERAIANASAIPGNVSIAENASMSASGVAVHATIDSAVSGTYNAVSYLLEFIDKQNVSNGYGPHDVDYVVRSTLFNHPVTLVAGSTTTINPTGTVNSSWNEQKLSVVTLVQQNSTRIVQNANMVPVTTLTTAVAATRTSVTAGTNTTVSVQVTNSTTGASVAGAAVSLTSNGGGSLGPASGVTASDGTFAANFTAPNVSSQQTVVITVQVNAAGYNTGSGTVTLLVNPVVSPNAATGLTIAPGNQRVSLNWTTPASGASGVSYYVYRGTSPDGVFSQVGVSATLGFNDSGLIGGLSYWYKISAHNVGGFSPNTTAVPATAVTGITQGLPFQTGWWISVGSAKFTSATDATMYLYLPSGIFTYQVGAESYAYVASAPNGSLTASGAALSLNASFAPRYASLQGTVTPANANVTVNGAGIAVVGGVFVDSLAAGTYTVNVTASGYQANSTSVTLTPGNTTPMSVALVTVQSGTSSSNGALTGTETIAILAVAAVIGAVAVIGGIVLMSGKGKRGPAQRTTGKKLPPSSP
jgi:PEGA domain-containing protein